MSRYDLIGDRYASRRRADPRLDALITAALGDARTVVDVGAGTGSYEPADRPVVAVEPSATMIRQRPPGSAPAVQAAAEDLPFPPDSFDASMAILTVHHWSDKHRGLAELCRVSRRRVILTFDPPIHNSLWLVRDYVPAAGRLEQSRGIPVEEVAGAIGATPHGIAVVPVPYDCVDGFGISYWRRPEAYLDPEVRSCISMLAALAPADLEPGLRRLEDDLRTGAWERRYADLLDLDTYDAGLRLITGEG
jgi:SAM-dependent methyltransferase